MCFGYTVPVKSQSITCMLSKFLSRFTIAYSPEEHVLWNMLKIPESNLSTCKLKSESTVNSEINKLFSFVNVT